MEAPFRMLPPHHHTCEPVVVTEAGLAEDFPQLSTHHSGSHSNQNLSFWAHVGLATASVPGTVSLDGWQPQPSGHAFRFRVREEKGNKGEVDHEQRN